MYCVNNRSKFAVDERIIFERLWRDALYQALGSKAPLRVPSRRPCCCRCRCTPQGTSFAPNSTIRQVIPPKKAMRSIIRYLYMIILYFYFLPLSHSEINVMILKIKGKVNSIL